jgi:hypothetical protein
MLHCNAETIRVTAGRQYFPQGPHVGQPCFRVYQKPGMKSERRILVRKDGMIRKDTSITSIELEKS